MSDRGVSENLGFVLVFALVVSTIAIVYTAGFSGLLDARNAEQFNNMERAFDVLKDNLDDLATGTAPSRATEIKLSGGNLRLGERTHITLRTNSTQDASCNATSPSTVSTRPLVYEDGDSEVVYSSGAILRTDSGSSVMLEGPNWLSDRRRTVLPLLTIVGGQSSTSVSGQTTVLVVASQRSNQFRCLYDSRSTPLRVNITIESSRASAWERYFRDRGYNINQSDSGVVSAEFNTTKFYVPDTVIAIEFE